MTTKRREYHRIVTQNPNNILINESNIKDIFSLVCMDIHVNDINVYRRAFIHKSYVIPSRGFAQDNSMTLMQPDSNERMEFLGDSVITCAIGTYNYFRYPNKQEGFMSVLKTRLVRKECLCILAKQLGLYHFMQISKEEEEIHNGRKNPRLAEDLFEAFIGAIYEDNYPININTISENTGMQTDNRDMNVSAWEICQKFIVRVMERYIDFTTLIEHNDNYKDMLLQYTQESYQMTPVWKELDTNGDGVDKTFKVGVLDTYGNIVGVGIAKKIKKAEQIASFEALKYHGIIEADMQFSEYQSYDSVESDISDPRK